MKDLKKQPVKNASATAAALHRGAKGLAAAKSAGKRIKLGSKRP